MNGGVKYSEIKSIKIDDVFWEVVVSFDDPGFILRSRKVTGTGPRQIKTEPVAWMKIDGKPGKTSKAHGAFSIHREWLYTNLNGDSVDRFEPPLYRTPHEALDAAADRLHAQSMKHRELSESTFRDAMTLHNAAVKIRKDA